MDPFKPDPRLLEALAHLDPQPWTGEVWRHSRQSAGGQDKHPRCAMEPASVEALYTSLDRDTAVAEADHVLAVQPIPPRATRTLHRLRLSLEAVLGPS